MKKKIILFIGFILFGLIAYTMLYFGIYTEFTADWNTVYIKDFTKEKLAQINRGMAKKEVIDILGKPFLDEIGCIHYSKGKTGIQVIPPFAEDYWYTAAMVCFDENGNVIGAALNKFFN